MTRVDLLDMVGALPTRIMLPYNMVIDGEFGMFKEGKLKFKAILRGL